MKLGPWTEGEFEALFDVTVEGKEDVAVHPFVVGQFRNITLKNPSSQPRDFVLRIGPTGIEALENFDTAENTGSKLRGWLILPTGGRITGSSAVPKQPIHRSSPLGITVSAGQTVDYTLRVYAHPTWLRAMSAEERASLRAVCRSFELSAK